MAKKRTNGVQTEEPAPDPPATDSNNHRVPQDKPGPVFKVGPISCDRSATVEVAVWENEVTLTDGQVFKVHAVTIHGRYRNDKGEWNDLRSFRGSYLHVLIYCLARAQDWILSQRDPASIPF